MKMPQARIDVTPRAILSGKRSRRVYDARVMVGRESYEATGATKRSAIALVEGIVNYVTAQLSAELDGWALYPCGVEVWTLRFPYGGSYVFGAKTFGDACVRLVGEYGSTHEVGRFVVACEARPFRGEP